jgi:cytoskeletal protein RodZ
MVFFERRVLLYILYVVIVAGLIVGIALAFRPSKISNSSSGQSGSSSGSTKAPIPPTSTSQKSGSSKSSTSNQVKSATQSTAGSSATPLANTGPGDVFAIFAVSSVAATLFWRHKLARDMLR